RLRERDGRKQRRAGEAGNGIFGDHSLSPSLQKLNEGRTRHFNNCSGSSCMEHRHKTLRRTRRRVMPELCEVGELVVRPRESSGREWFPFRLPFVEDGDGLEAIVASATVPEIGDAILSLFHPVRRCNRLAALGTRISARKTVEIRSRHGALPQTFLY